MYSFKVFSFDGKKDCIDTIDEKEALKMISLNGDRKYENNKKALDDFVMVHMPVIYRNDVQIDYKEFFKSYV